MNSKTKLISHGLSVTSLKHISLLFIRTVLVTAAQKGNELCIYNLMDTYGGSEPHRFL